MPPIADLGDFFDAVDKFFSSLAKIQWGSLILALLLFGVYLTFRARASAFVSQSFWFMQWCEFICRIWSKPKTMIAVTDTKASFWSRHRAGSGGRASAERSCGTPVP